MSLENLLNHTCDIYHLQEGERSPGYNLPASPSFSYPEEPDISRQSCHFGVRSQSVTVTQTAPANILDAKIKLTLPIGTDIRLNRGKSEPDLPRTGFNHSVKKEASAWLTE